RKPAWPTGAATACPTAASRLSPASWTSGDLLRIARPSAAPACGRRRVRCESRFRGPLALSAYAAGRPGSGGENGVAGFLATLRSGDWLTRERLRLLPIAVLIMSVFAIVYVVTTSDGLNDYQGRPLGSDFSNVYAAGNLVRDGHAATAYDWPQH